MGSSGRQQPGEQARLAWSGPSSRRSSRLPAGTGSSHSAALRRKSPQVEISACGDANSHDKNRRSYAAWIVFEVWTSFWHQRLMRRRVRSSVRPAWTFAATRTSPWGHRVLSREELPAAGSMTDRSGKGCTNFTFGFVRRARRDLSEITQPADQQRADKKRRVDGEVLIRDPPR